MRRVYISGKMTGLPDLGFPLFNAEAARLRALGFDVVNPAELNPDPASTWADCMRVDIAALVTCDGLALLPGHESSRGARLEFMIAEALCMRFELAADIVHGPAQWAREAA